MKIMFFFNWEFSYICHALAVRLRQKYGKNAEFCGVAVQKKEYDFLMGQKDVDYSRLYQINEFMNPKHVEKEQVDLEYLRKMEKEYGDPNLWLALFADRDLTTYNKFHNYSHGEALKFLQSCIRGTEKILDEAKPDAVVFDCIASLPSYALYTIAKKKGAKIILPTTARTGNRFVFSGDTFEGFDKALESFEKNEVEDKYLKEADAFLETFRKARVKPEYFANEEKVYAKRFSLGGQLAKIPRAMEYALKSFTGEYENDYFYYKRSLDKMIVERIRQNLRRRGSKALFKKPDLTKNYAFFPLHFEPEMATMVMAPMYVNQLAVAENIAKSLPVDFLLYVKDHPSMALTGNRNPEYYEQLKKIPNIVLIDPVEDSKKIIDNSKLVFVITGTAGWEAVMLKKPVVTFGRVFFNRMNTVYKCRSYLELPEIVRKALNAHEHDENELRRMLGAIMKHSFDVRLTQMYFNSRETAIKDIMAHPDFEILAQKFAEEAGLG